MEKVKLNNQIVLMRKHVKQAKVHAINRLTKEVKLLQNRKGDETRVLKAKRKAERYLQEISLLKKIKPDCVSKLALSKAKNWKEVLSQKSSTLEDRCFAILANYGPVQKEVELFHNSNKDIVSKISDFLKHWEDKSKFPKGFPKNINFQNNSNFVKIKMTEGLLNMTNQSASGNNENNKPFNEKTDSNLLTKNSLNLKNKKREFEASLKKKLSPSIKPSQNPLLTENKCDNSHNSEHPEENKREIKTSDEIESKPKTLLNNVNRDELMDWTDSNAGSEMKIGYEISNESKTENEFDVDKDKSENESDLDKDKSENESDLDKDKSENESDMDKHKSENENSGLEIIPENKPKTEFSTVKVTNDKKFKLLLDSESNSDCAAIKKSPYAENVITSSLIPVKMDKKESKSGENKLKAIVMINLDDFKDLDEIPVDNSAENTESSEEEDVKNDDLSDQAPQNDPFFLGHDEAISTENKLVDNLKSNNFFSMNEIFERKEKSSNHCNYTKNFHKPLNNSCFSSKYSQESKAEGNFKTWKKDKLLQNHHRGKFQSNSTGSFDSEVPRYKYQPYKHQNIDRNIKNKKEFNQKASLETYGYNKRKSSNEPNHRNDANSFRNTKEPHKKDDINSKPLHPSWEAKKKQKEMVNVSFQGKKVVFDD